MWAQICVAVIAGYVAGVFYGKAAQKTDRVEMLKNALLTFALARVNQEDFDNENMNYAEFDGSKLPMLSGADATNALMSYIIDKGKLRKDPFYTKIMEDKVAAIEKYLAVHFDSDDKVEAFIADLIQRCQ